jgi:prepilin-type N-terminal cleavage/methylation domain-containing protein
VNKVKGFTLVEVLITMALLSMIILIGSSAFGLFAKRWDGQLGKFDETMQNARNVMLVQEVLDSLVPYMAYDTKGKPKIYFEGNRNGFVAVSSKSIYGAGGFAVVRFSVRQKADLAYQVIYEEWPMSDDVLRSIDQPIIFSSPLILFDTVTNPRFEYFGWADLEDKVPRDDTALPKPPSWLKNYNALAIGLSPLKAALRFTTPSGDLQAISILASEKPALLSGYRGRFKKQGVTQQLDNQTPSDYGDQEDFDDDYDWGW